MAQKFLTEITLQALNNATTDTDKFLVSDGGTIKFRTGAEVLSDIGAQPAGGVSFNDLIAKTGGTGTYQTSGDFRAPIFYDSSNTNYYVDPNGISSLYGLAIRGDQSSVDTSNQIFLWGSGNTTTSAIGFKQSGGSFPNPTGNGDGYNTYLTMDSPGRGWVFREGVGGTNFNAAYTSGWILNNGVWQANASMRAPIFYDSNDTNYYVDPASNSSLKAVTTNGVYTQYATSIGSPSANFGNGRAYLNVWPTASGSNIVSFKIMISTNWNWAPGFGYITADVSFYFDGTNLYYATTTITSATGQARINLGIGNPIIDGGNVCIPIYSSNSNAVFAKLEGSPGFNWSVVNWGNWQSVAFPGSAIVSIPGDATVEGILQSNSSVRGPIFYDSNNTAYYLDPASTSNLLGLTVVNTITGNISGTAGSLLSYQSNWASTPTPDNVVGLLGWKNYGNGHVIFDASASTTPSGTGCSNTNPQNNWTGTFPTLMGWNGANTYGVRVDSARIADTATSAGSVDFNNLTNKTSGTGTYQTSGDFRAPIFYDSDNTGYYLDPNNTSNIYRLTMNERITLGVFPASTVNTGEAWIGKASDRLTGTMTVQLGGNSPSSRFFEVVDYAWSDVLFSTSSTGISTASASFRAPIFYDSNNTAYYTDPASTSNLASSYIAGHYYGSSNSSNILIRTAGSSSEMGIVGQSSSGAFRFQLYGYNGTEYGFLSAEWSSWDVRKVTSGNMYLNNQGSYYYGTDTAYLLRVYGTTDMRSPIYYDLNNTAYYVDPNGTSNINGLLVGGLNVIKTWQTIAGNIDNDYGEGFVTFDPVPAGTPPLASPNIRTVNIGDNFNRRTQLAFDYSSDSAYFRRRQDSTWYSWREFVHSGNVSSYAVPLSRTITINGVTQDLSANRSWTVTAVETDTLQTVTGRGNTTSNGLIATASESREVSTYFPSSYGLNDLVSGHNYKWYSDTWRLGATRSGAQPAADFVIQFNGSNRINLSTSGNLTASADMRAPVFYDSNNTTYYLDPNNTTKAINVAGKLTVNVGSSSGTPVFEATGTYGTMSINTYYGVLHTSGDFYIGLPASSGNNLYGNQARFASFIDRNNSAYYLTPSSGSNLNTGNLAGRWKYSDYLVSNNSGGLMGDYNVTGATAKCIWTIGESWPLANMYGLAYEYDGTYAHNLALKANGTTYARLGFGGEGAYFTGGVTSGTAMYSPIYYDSNDTTFYFQGSNYGDSIRCAGDIVAYYSDERLKDRKGNIENALEKVLSLNGFYYEPNETAQALGYKKKLEVGVSAQEVQAILPEIIKDAPIGGDYKTLDYGRLTPLLIEAIKEQQTQIDELKELVNKLINK